jgi:hypothetical protein
VTTLFDGPHFTFRALRPNLRRAQRIARDGTPAGARIVGIRVLRGNDDSPDQHEWALEIAPGAGDTLRAGCRQRLSAERLERLRLGDEVRVLVDDRDGALIHEDGDLAQAELGHKVLTDPPRDGIYDENADLTKERRRSLEARVVIRGAERVTVMGMATMSIRLEVEVRPEGQAPFRTTLKREPVPFYATHLVAAGTVLPGTARPGRTDKIRIDWPAAAMAVPGNGVAPALERSAEAAAPISASATSHDWTPEGLAADGDLGERGAVTFEQWVAVSAGLVRDRVKPANVDAYAAQHGVATGAWREAEAAWTAAAMSDPRVGARYGAAFEAARKRR